MAAKEQFFSNCEYGEYILHKHKHTRTCRGGGGLGPSHKLRKILQFKNTKFGPPVGGFFSGYSGFPPFRLALKNSVHVWGRTKRYR
jgi:hypothetical protein